MYVVAKASYLLDHVEDRFIFVQPYVVVWNRHGLKSDTFSILEEGVWSPYFC